MRTKIALQAIAETGTLEHRGYEVLARNEQASLGFRFAPPDRDWGWWMTDLCVMDRVMRRQVQPTKFVSLNLSPETMQNEHAWALWLAGLGQLVERLSSPDLVTIEFSERVCYAVEWSVLHQRIREIHALGVPVALDDLDGSPEMRHLMDEHDWNIIKIDWRMPRRDQHDDLSSVMRECERRGLRTVLEGVEYSEDIRYAGDLGVTFVQGFGVHRPMLLA